MKLDFWKQGIHNQWNYIDKSTSTEIFFFMSDEIRNFLIHKTSRQLFLVSDELFCMVNKKS